MENSWPMWRRIAVGAAQETKRDVPAIARPQCSSEHASAGFSYRRTMRSSWRGGVEVGHKQPDPA